MPKIKPLKTSQLCTLCDPKRLNFKSTLELDDLNDTIGQDRALQAIEFGVGIKKDGYNLFVLGPPGTGKYSTVRDYLQTIAAKQNTSHDWMYVYNFKQSHKPLALKLPTGKGVSLKKDMAQLVEDLRSAIPAAFETEEYQTHIHEIETEFEEFREEAFMELSKESGTHDIRLLRTPSGFAFAPVQDDKVIRSKDYEKLPEKDRTRIEQVIEVLEEKLALILRQIPLWQRQARDKIKTLNREIATFAVENIIDDVKQTYKEYQDVIAYLDNVQEDVVDQANMFRQGDEKPSIFEIPVNPDAFFNRYKINLLIDNSAVTGRPVIYEDNPSYQNLVGRVEHLSQMGTLVTDFTLIKPGALHLANDGYLILDAEKVLLQAYSWEGLKRTLNAHEIRIQSLGEVFSLISTVSLEPQPIPLNIKIVLIGERMLYYLLSAYDSEFDELFKIAADFEESIVRSPATDMLYARIIATLARKEELLPLSNHAVARIIEQSSRQAEEAKKVSTHMLSVLDLMRESDQFARNNNHDIVSREDVQSALDAKDHRHDRLRFEIYEEINNNTILIATEGSKVGQVNALSVIDLGQFMFGQPTRITATTRLGDGEVIDIEHESKLGGSIHSKGVMILTAFLANRYAKNCPLSLSATLVFEQNYGMIEGDSASMAELCTLLSSISDIPIKQNFAITGSVNQFGESQAIGGVNDKIEGFFEVCSARGLTGEQGVLIPEANVKHLMLAPKVVAAVKEGLFKIYPTRNVDDAIELLTGIPAGTLTKKGVYTKNSVNFKVKNRLSELTELKKSFEHHGHHDDTVSKSKD